MRKILTGLLRISAAFPILFLAWILYRPETIFLGRQVISPFFNLTGQLKLWEYLVICLIILCCFSLVMMTVLNIYSTLTKNRTDKLRRHYEIIFTEYLIEYFFSANKGDPAQLILTAKIKKRTRKRIQLLTFLKIYIKIQENVAVNLGPKFLELAEVLGIWKKIEKLLHNRNFSDNLLALKIISSLDIRRYNSIIYRFTKSNNYALRTEAISALMQLSGKRGLSVLIDHPHHLSMLDINVILNAVLCNQDVDVDYLSLLRSKVPEKILVAVLIARHKKLIEVKDEIKALIGHPDETLNYELWSAYLALEEDQAKCTGFIIENFESQPEKIKSLILSAEIKKGDMKYDRFIAGVVRKDDSLNIKTAAMRLLFKSNFDSISQFTDSHDAKISMAYREVIDFNI